MMGRAWLASAGWALLCCVAAQVFITAAAIALFLLFFGAVVTAMFPPLLLLLGVGDGTGWHIVLVVAGTGVIVLGLSGALTRWAFRRCRAVLFPIAPGAPVQWSWAKRSSVLAGIVAGFVFVTIVPALAFGAMPGMPKLPIDAPGSSGTV